LLLIVAIWLAMLAALENQWRQTYDQATAAVNNLASAYSWQLHREIQSVDQTLRIVAGQWEADKAHFDPSAWPTRSVLLADVAEQITVLDRNGRVVSSSQAKWVGADWHEQPCFTAAQLGQSTTPYIGPIQPDPMTGRAILGVSRRLPDPAGNFVGVLLATIDVRDAARGFGEVDLGPNGLVALIGPGPVAFRLFDDRPMSTASPIEGTAMWQAALGAAQGDWVGLSAPDGQRRIHAFRRLVPDEPGIVVGIDYENVMRQALVWRRQGLLFALGLTCLVIAAFGLLVRQLEDARDREEQVGREREKLAAAYLALATAHAHADAKSNELSATITGMSDGIMMLDGDLRLMQWNQHYPEIDGVPQEALRVGMSMEEILRVQVRAGEFGMVDEEAEVERRMALFLNGGAQSGQMRTIERTRPNMRTVELRRSALAGGGFVTLYTDITPRKQAQALQEEARRLAEEMAEAKSRFVAIVSHEIRTPLNAVLNALTLLSETPLQPSQRSLTDRASQAGEALLHLLTDILEMSKMEAGELALRPEVFALRPLLEGVAEMFDAPARARGMTLVVDMSSQMPMPERMRADPGRLRQILMNLVSNAVKYARPGQITIKAETQRVFGRLGLRLSVQDGGPVIAPADAQRLFQPFVRLENAAYARTGGTGLGLAICRRLAELMGGKIGLRSLEAGNEFWVSLPLEVAGTAAITWSAPKTSLPSAATRPRPPRTRILLVEDVPANQIITATLLRREGHKVDVARSGAEAIAMAPSGIYDVVLMDLSMPGMSGLEAAKRLRSLAQPVASLPIIAVTANVSDADRAACLATGMNDMLAKPVSVEALQAALLRHAWSRQTPAPVHVTVPRSHEPRLDVHRINDLRNSLPKAAFASVVETCLVDLHKLMPELRRALAEGSDSDIKNVAHAIAGVAGMYGLTGLRQQLESLLRSTSAGHTALATDIEAELQQTTDALRAFVVAQAA
jgi:signal transduction histidine kinase/ActR/RegA family two-component response regulator/HPt (histidine-containing phosphotransfer) domain-containing protein